MASYGHRVYTHQRWLLEAAMTELPDWTKKCQQHVGIGRCQDDAGFILVSRYRKGRLGNPSLHRHAACHKHAKRYAEKHGINMPAEPGRDARVARIENDER